MKNIHIIATDKPSRLFIIDKSKMFLSEPPHLSFSTIGGKVHKIEGSELYQPQNMYITNNEEIKEGDKWIYNTHWNEPQKIEEDWVLKILNESSNTFKIILSTDQDLIKDGVQAIDDEFLNWFVSNPSCEEVKVENSSVVKEHIFDGSNDGEVIWEYKIIIPSEEPKQELLPDFKITKNIFDFVNDLSDTKKEEPKQETLEEDDYSKILKATMVPKEYFGTKQETLEEAAENYKINIKEAIQFGAKWQAEKMYREAIEFGKWLDENMQQREYYPMSAMSMEELFEQFKNK